MGPALVQRPQALAIIPVPKGSSPKQDLRWLSSHSKERKDEYWLKRLLPKRCITKAVALSMCHGGSGIWGLLLF